MNGATAIDRSPPLALAVETRLELAVGLSLALIVAAIGGAILILCGGHLIYSLDDPYISLALADQIAQGHYGINAGEASSPSSSILYPLLLAAFAWARWQDWVPAIVNAAAACATGALFAREIWRMGIVTKRGEVAGAAILAVLLCLAVNVVGLVFVGLEHSLHLLTSVFVVFALARVLEGARPTNGLAIAIVLLPLWRFEGLALAGLAILALLCTRHWRTALIAATAIAVALGCYMAAMGAMGLPLLPSSVLVKSDIARQVAAQTGLGAAFSIAAHNLAGSLRNSEAYPVFLLLIGVIARPFYRMWRRDTAGAMSLHREWIFAGVVAGTLAAHILFGAWGWFARYEAYAVAAGAAGAMVLWRQAIAMLIARRSTAAVVASALALLFVGRIYVIAEAVTPVASLGIYEQHYQMHRFAADFYKRPVGVNDLGLVGYRNPNYVLDLWGLGSEEARKARAGGDPDWLGRLVAAHQVGLVMIYEPWFEGRIPPTWRRLATLTAGHRITAAFDTVSFYATSEGEVPAALEALRAFGRTLGPGTRLTID